MNVRSLLLAVGVFVAALPASADPASSLHHAWAAQSLLGGEVWTRVLQIENESTQSAYPAKFHALVFEFAGVLWFYTDSNGTQSLSLHRGRLKEEKADLAPLLQAIDAGFVRWAVVEPAPTQPVVTAELPNGCFVESIATWQTLRRRGIRGEAKLLSFYADPRVGGSGHTVLALSDGDRVKVIDPADPKTIELPRHLESDPLAMARAVAGRIVAKARFLTLPGVVSPGAGSGTAAA